jgi:hypothetical protein
MSTAGRELTFEPSNPWLDVKAGSGHDLVPYPKVGKFAEVRMVYCRRCGATQTVEAGDRNALGPCALSGSSDPEAVGLDVERLRIIEHDADEICEHDNPAREDWPCTIRAEYVAARLNPSAPDD